MEGGEGAEGGGSGLCQRLCVRPTLHTSCGLRFGLPGMPSALARALLCRAWQQTLLCSGPRSQSARRSAHQHLSARRNIKMRRVAGSCQCRLKEDWTLHCFRSVGAQDSPSPLCLPRVSRHASPPSEPSAHTHQHCEPRPEGLKQAVGGEGGVACYASASGRPACCTFSELRMSSLGQRLWQEPSACPLWQLTLLLNQLALLVSSALAYTRRQHLGAG